jgi:excinuclease UvrABC nuclease subunit
VEKYVFDSVEIPETSGVYFLYGERDELLYIGKSKNLKSRLNTHFRSKAGNKLRNLGVEPKKFSMIFEENEKLDNLEKDMIAKYLPPYNKALTKQNRKGRVKASFAIDANLHDELKIKAIRENKTVSELAEQAMRDYIGYREKSLK